MVGKVKNKKGLGALTHFFPDFFVENGQSEIMMKILEIVSLPSYFDSRKSELIFFHFSIKLSKVHIIWSLGRRMKKK